jgi:hypothetical protein
MFQLHNTDVQFIVLIFTQLCNSSCFQSHVSLSVCVTNLLVVVESDISSASSVTAHVLVFTLVTPPSICKFPLPKILWLFTVLMLVPLTKAFCLPLNVEKSSFVKYQSALAEAVPNLVLIVA